MSGYFTTTTRSFHKSLFLLGGMVCALKKLTIKTLTKESGVRGLATLVLTVFGFTSWAIPAGATPVLSPIGGGDTLNGTGTFTYGWEFNVLSEITIDNLGVYDNQQDGLAESHEVGIWNSAGTLLVSTTVGAGTGSTLDGIFRMQDVVDTVLSIGTGYVIGATNWDVDMLSASAASLVSAPSISFVESRFLYTGGNLLRPTSTIGRLGYFGPSFSLAESYVPTPSTLALFGLGLAGLGFARKKKA